MKIVDIKFTTDKYHQDDEIDDFIDNLINDMRNQGRITGKPLSLLEKDTSFIINCRVPEHTSLNVIAENHWFKELENKNIKITYSVLGKDVWSPDICKCKKSKFYILSASRPIPLLCGVCMDSIPLYKLPFTYEADPSYYDIVSWNNENKAWGTIEFSSLTEIEKIAQHELCDIDSNHTITALKICSTIKNKTNIDCYYDLENLRDEESIENEISKKCPKCNGDWILKEKLNDIYDFNPNNEIEKYQIRGNTV
jgi:predicted  nucleic acid-binding Zn ribbon protein